jgi:hypothetical protein
VKNIIRGCFIVIILAAVISGPVLAEKIKFRFNPPDSISYTQNLVTTQVQKVGLDFSQTSETESSATVTILKTTEGYILRTVVESMMMSRNGQQIENPLASLMRNLVISYHLDSDGKVIKITGIDEFVEVFKQSIPPEAAQSLSGVINKEALEAKAMEEWEGQGRRYIGQTVEIGDVFIDTSDFALTGDEAITYYNSTEFSKTVKCGKDDCVVIDLNYNTNADALMKTKEDLAADLAQFTENPPTSFEIKGSEMTGSGQIILNPATMLVKSDTSERIFKMMISAPGQEDTPMVLHEKQVYTFEY